jgi:hypothetical protein
MMSTHHGDYGKITRMAKTKFIFQPIDAAFPRANVTGD